MASFGPGEVRAMAVQDGRLLDVAIHRPGRPDGVGDRHRGRVVAHVPALGGAFVALDGADGFLPDSEGGAGLSTGDAVAVRVTRAAQGGKGPRLSARVPDLPDPPGGTGLLSRGPGAVQRLAALHPTARILVDSQALMADLRPGLGPRLHLARTLDTNVLAELDDLSDPAVPLPGGMRATIHPTPALVAIDVDGASASAERRPKATAQFAANRVALPELARQIRLRNLSGAILLDLAGLPAAKRAALGPDLAAALAADPLRPRLLGFTRLGLAEIVRPRIHPPLHEMLAGPHAAGLAALRDIAQRAAAQPATAFALRAAPDVVAALQDDPVALPALTHGTGRPLPLRSDPRLAAGCTVIEVLQEH